MNRQGDIFTTRLKISNDILTDFPNPSMINLSSEKNDIDVLFYRYIGSKASKDSYVNRVRSVFTGLLEKDIPFFHYTNEISGSLDSDSVSNMKKAFSNCHEHIDIKCVCNYLEKNNSFYATSNGVVNNSSIVSFRRVLSLFMANNRSTSVTIVKNFCAKLLSWINTTLSRIDSVLEEYGSNGSIVLPKIVYLGDIKNHEIYFLIFLSMIGCDVLFINSNSDCEFKRVDKYETYSKLQVNKNLDLKIEYDSLVPSIPKEYFSYSESPDSIIASLKNTNKILSDILSPLNKRSGFARGDSPVIPVYFHRLVGIYENHDDYYNALYSLDKHLSKFKSLYVKFNGRIPVPSNNSSANVNSKLKDIFKNFDFKNSILWVNFFKKNQMTKITKSDTINNSFEKNLKLVLDLYIKNTPDMNFTKLKNFCLKMLIWGQEYLPGLFSEFDFSDSDSKAYNPKIVYYGNIKLHEIYFLILLSRSGCDVLYVNSASDCDFSSIDKNQVYSKLVLLKQNSPLKPFPKSEVITRHETVAYKSSMEISDIIYSNEDGLYKPWQFENHKTSLVTLKTTYDELKILWNEEARLRSGFKADSQTVFIPNLFSKISGVNADIIEYAKDVNMFKSAENVFFTDIIPFSQPDSSASKSPGYSKSGTANRDYVYPYRFFFDDKGHIDKKALFSNRLYKFSHIKTCFQEAIMEKVQYLMDSDILLMGHYEDMRIKILSVILNMDKRLLNLIQKFDYPFKVPKFVAYHSSETIFSIEDCIIIAFLYLFGFDILIITPTGYNNMEKYINSKYFDVHKLENVKFDLEMQKLFAYSNFSKKKTKSIWSGLFGINNK